MNFFNHFLFTFLFPIALDTTYTSCFCRVCTRETLGYLLDNHKITSKPFKCYPLSAQITWTSRKLIALGEQKHCEVNVRRTMDRESTSSYNQLPTCTEKPCRTMKPWSHQCWATFSLAWSTALTLNGRRGALPSSGTLCWHLILLEEGRVKRRSYATISVLSLSLPLSCDYRSTFVNTPL